MALADGFYTIVLPRRVRHIFRPTAVFYRVTWNPFSAIGRHISDGRRREEYLSIYGPLSLLTLLICWAAALVIGFGLLQWAARLQVRGHPADFMRAIWVSASSLLMIATGEPSNGISRWLMTIEAGLGFGLLGLVVGYLPVLYQSYASRELRISLLDARAGSPPSSGELLVRQSRNAVKLEQQLAAWEEWSAELLEEQLSYPMLAYFRSQHQNQSWLAALIALLDAACIVLLCSDEDLKRQAHLTFAMGRHTLVDLATVFRAAPRPLAEDRLRPEQLEELRGALQAARSCLQTDALSADRLGRLRQTYEPYANSLSDHFLIALPGWLPHPSRADNWQVTEWDHPGAPFAVSDPFKKSNPPAA